MSGYYPSGYPSPRVARAPHDAVDARRATASAREHRDDMSSCARVSSSAILGVSRARARDVDGGLEGARARAARARGDGDDDEGAIARRRARCANDDETRANDDARARGDERDGRRARLGRGERVGNARERARLCQRR